ncbi:MAG: hypothetical protein MJZ11_00575 [Lachnospiraceae bacterium]|nr:hypothetical protein [Lachnospiraceae bacterium]
MFKRIIKGDFNYLSKKKARVIIMTVFLFAMSIGIFITGYVTTGTKKNLLTIVAVLGCLPASKSAVSMIMFLRAKGCPLDIKEKIEPHTGKLVSMYDMYFTSYDANFPILHMIVNNKVVIGFYNDLKFDDSKCVKHLTTMLANAGYNNVTISLTSDLNKYINMLDNFNEKDILDESVQDDEIRISLYEITL